jgi:DNA repair exonuclease SbcCD ATPase subunit
LERELDAHFGGQTNLVLSELQSRQNAWSHQQGVVQECKRVQANRLEILKDLECRAEKDQKKMLCITRLRELKDLMSRQGLPGRYVAHRFQQLAALTACHLAKMNAGFTVSIDTKEPLSFRFQRQDDKTDLQMVKMSGGQRVRLSLAFLMAVQEALVPDVGLLVLDEPSMHLDSEGKESLAELLTETGRRLSSGETQVWVSDHAHELEPAFGAVLKL